MKQFDLVLVTDLVSTYDLIFCGVLRMNQWSSSHVWSIQMSFCFLILKISQHFLLWKKYLGFQNWHTLEAAWLCHTLLWVVRICFIKRLFLSQIYTNQQGRPQSYPFLTWNVTEGWAPVPSVRPCPWTRHLETEKDEHGQETYTFLDRGCYVTLFVPES